MFLSLLIVSCGTTKTDIRYETWTPPDELLRDSTVTPWSGDTWADVVELAEERRKDVQRCNADKAALREQIREIREQQED